MVEISIGMDKRSNTEFAFIAENPALISLRTDCLGCCFLICSGNLTVDKVSTAIKAPKTSRSIAKEA